MIARCDYAGPITKSAEAMFARADRRASRAGQKTAGARRRPISPLRQAVQALGVTMSLIRQWEEAGVIALARVEGRRIADEATLEHLETVLQLRREGFTIKEIRWLSDTLPPSLRAMRDALNARRGQLTR